MKMAFMDNMRDKLTQASQSTVKKAKELTDLAMLNAEVAGVEKQISDLYEKIGCEIYNTYKDQPLAEVADLIGQITVLQEDLEKVKGQLKAKSGVDTCPNCGAKTTKTMTFCGNCGSKLESEVVEEMDLKECSNCSHGNKATDSFCQNCGSRL